MLTIHRAEQADRLVEALASLIVEPLDDPLAVEIVSVATRGIERWLTERVSTVLGTSANRQDGVRDAEWDEMRARLGDDACPGMLERSDRQRRSRRQDTRTDRQHHHRRGCLAATAGDTEVVFDAADLAH